jgi:hypothetical protein
MKKGMAFVLGAIIVVLSFLQFATALSLMQEVAGSGTDITVGAGTIALPTLIAGLAIMSLAKEDK